jgi:carboxylesterase
MKLYLTFKDLALIALFSTMAWTAHAVDDQKMPKDPKTGVIKGTEAVVLQPKNPRPEMKGRACLLIHGFVGARTDFADMGNRLAEQGFTVNMMRLPGHGTKPEDFAVLKKGDLLEAVRKEYLNMRKQYRQVDVIGFSMGGALATLLASQEPMDRLVLVAPYYKVKYRWYYILPAETWNKALGSNISYVRKPERFIQLNDRSKKHLLFCYNRIPTAGVNQLVDLGLEAQQPQVLANVKCPLLMVVAEQDAAACPKAARKAYDQIGSTHKDILTVKRSNHQIFYDYDNMEVKDRIMKFLMEPRDLKMAAKSVVDKKQ